VYVPRFNALDDLDEIRALVSAAGSCQLVTSGEDGYPLATLLPVVWEEAAGRLVLHMARANAHWKAIPPGTPGLAVVTGPEAYVSPAWYASKAEHGRVVPTWNYAAVHFTGRVTVHQDVEWVRDAVTLLTGVHEGRRSEQGRQAWSVEDAPTAYVAKQLKVIVGIELEVERVEAKAKYSQNRSDADRTGVVAGLRDEHPDGGARGEAQVADRMAGDLAPPGTPHASGISSQAAR
jgi:transcriptional regulator